VREVDGTDMILVITWSARVDLL